MQTVFNTLLQPFFPSRCLLCDFISDNKKLICQSCFDTLPSYHNSFSNEENIIALFDYQHPISTLIWKLKFRGDLSIAHFFSQCWIEKINSHYANNPFPEFIMPVPLHPARLKERGFNQALEIAKPIGKYFSIPIDTRTCIRIKNTKAQSLLAGDQRKNNIKNAFGLSYSINAKHIAIIDDVYTTGSTVLEISALLKKSGVEKIEVWCCARTITHAVDL
ncbi:MAG: ComF family protein [uncultured bacterium]|nr:MAG: ComF family protein [uncultured bacterium]OGT32352.1 MAG: hypothetical protein A3C44_06820 [Gammaproteobacteria bacterium RIFCSPHIGHO2_02_FULL_39_13]OGT48146.1 MAG: hypothetical protein A3E53_03030 [Gammaproteobacteria bacterium RIFCSPHIGHO2_12_FULL_39_24]